MEYIDFSNCKLSNRRYGGAERKLGIIYFNNFYMLKFKKKTVFGVRNNTLSEYIGSNIYRLLGINAQEVLLGVYKNEEVVACKDFIVNETQQFIPFNDIGESTIETDKENYQYSYKDILALLKKNKKLTDVSETISSFFEIYIVDALIGNFDRHGANWGFIKENNKYFLAPVFDNGSSLFPNLTNEDEMKEIINNEEEMNKRVYNFPLSQIRLNNKKSSYYDVISSLKFKEINSALKKITPKVNLEKIYKLIDEIDILNNIHKEFYKEILKFRYNKILVESYNKLMELEK